MSEKRLKALVVALAVLLLLWLGVTFLPWGGGVPGPSEALTGFFDGVTPEAVTAVHLRGPGEGTSVELRHSGGEWSVNGYRADSAAVARFWTTVQDAEVGDLVASNPGNHARLGVAPDSTWTMELDLSGDSRTLMLGDPGSRYGTTYVRLPDEDEVYLLTGDLRSQVTRGLDGWRNKVLARVDTAAVQRLVVDREGGGYELTRSDSLWQVTGNGEANQTTVRSLLGELARLDASGFFAPGDSLADRGGSLLAVGEAGDTLFAMEIGAGEGDRWVRIPGDSITYRIASWRVGTLLPETDRVEGGG